MNLREMGRALGLFPKDQERATNPDLAAWRAEVITSILTAGLKSGQTLTQEKRRYLGSVDLNPPSSIEGRVIFPESHFSASPDFAIHIKNALYLNYLSVLRVLLERHKDHYWDWKWNFNKSESNIGVLKNVFTERVGASFLVVVRSDERNSLWIKKMSERELTPDQFTYLVFPQSIYDEYRKTTNGDSPPVETGAKVRVVSDTIQCGMSVGGNWPLSLTTPNFERAISEIVNELGHPLWIHGVRLPTKEDLQRPATSALQ